MNYSDILKDILFLVNLLHENLFIDRDRDKLYIENIKRVYSLSPSEYWGINSNSPLKLTFLKIDSGNDCIPFFTKYNLNESLYTIELEMSLDYYGKMLGSDNLTDPFERYQLNLDFRGYRNAIPSGIPYNEKYYASWHLDKHKRINKITPQDIEILKNKKNQNLTAELIEKLENALNKLPKTGQHKEISNLEYQELLYEKGQSKLSRENLSLIFEILESDNFAHPEYHLHFGGKNLRKHRDKFGSAIILDSPRIMHYPMDFPLAVHFILTNFYSRDRRQRLVNNPTYIKIIKNAKERVLRPYFSSIVNNWDSNPENPFHFSYITGIK